MSKEIVEAQLVHKDREGKTIYTNAKTTADMKAAWKILDRVKKDVFDYNQKHAGESPESMEYRYSIGRFLYEESHAISVNSSQRVTFAKLIETEVDVNALLGRDIGKSASGSRHPYLLTCQWIYDTFDEEVALSMTWSDLSEIYARPKIRDDKRIAKWMSENRKKLNRDRIREVLKALTYYVEDHDLSFLDQDALYERLEKFLSFEVEWQRCFKKYFTDPGKKVSAAREKNSKKYKKKYILSVMESTKFLKADDISEECEKAFKTIYVDIGTSNTNS